MYKVIERFEDAQDNGHEYQVETFTHVMVWKCQKNDSLNYLQQPP
ncbi:hypothetical protein ACVXZZ_13460 [Staphylococcus aureus]